VVVIDEIHRLSRQAFDALLKIVEEPPPHLVFVFATTEVDAVPATVLSRCQEFHFRRVRPALLTTHLRMLAENEKIEVSDTALRLIARAGEGSVRDSVALLDQLATFSSGKIADEDAARILGGVGATVHFRLLSAMVEGLSQEVAAVVGEIEDEGWDPRHVFGEFLSYCRDALHLALGADATDIELPEEDAEQLARLAQEAGYENLLRLLHQLLGSESSVRRSEAGTLAVEIAWLRAAELPKLTQIEELLAGGTPPAGAGSRPQKKPQKPRQPSPPPPPKKAARVADTVEPTPPETQAQEASAVSPPPSPASSTDASRIEDFLVEVSRRRQPLAAHLQESLRLDFEDGLLSIYTAPEDKWLATSLARGNNRQVLEESLVTVWGEGTRWRLQERGDLGPQTATEAAPAEDEEILKHPFVQKALDIFGGSARAIKSDDSKEVP